MTDTNLQHKTPAILLIHGGWANSTIFSPFTQRLQSIGYVVSCPTLPSNNGTRPPNASLPEDVAVIRNALDALILAAHPVLALMHSYGGFAGSEAFSDMSLTLENRAKVGRPGGLARLIYLAARMLLPGVSISDVRGKVSNDTNIEVYEDGSSRLLNAAETSYNDLDPETARRVADQIPTFNIGVLRYPFSNAPWREIPTTYVHCTQDRTIPIRSQEAMVRDAVENGGVRDLVLERLDATHSAFFSVPDEVVNIVNDAWRTVKVTMK